MGDRANIIFVDEYGEAPIYFYTHWNGYELPVTLQNALARRERWDDGPYLARIIFEQMIKFDGGTGTSYGISTCLTDNEYPFLVVDVKAQKVKLVPHVSVLKPADVEPAAEWSFEDYVKLDIVAEKEDSSWDKLKRWESREAS